MNNLQPAHTESEASKLIRFFRAGEQTRFRRGEHVLQEDSGTGETKRIFYIQEGFVKVYVPDRRGRKSIQIIYGPGEIFPLVWLNNSDLPLGRFFQSMGESVLCSRTKDEVMALFAADSEFAHDMLQQIIKQFALFHNRVANLTHTYASERVAYRLVVLADRFGVHDGDMVVIDVPLSHQTIADSINVSREVVTREITKLTKNDIIKIEDDRIIITDITKLCRQFSTELLSS